MKGNQPMTMNTLCRKINRFRSKVREIAKRNGIHIYLGDITDENETPYAPNIVFGFSGSDEKQCDGFETAFNEVYDILGGSSYVMEYECNGDGDCEILMSYRVV